MKRMALTLGLLALLLGLHGCGPMTAPMAPRLDEEEQKVIDEAWEKALSPPDRLDHQQWLDVFVGTGAYQRGIDSLYFHSKKRFSGGVVVMEVHFDRAAPFEDRFEVMVLDLDGKVVRQERYGREEVEETYRALFVHPPRKEKEGKVDPALAEQRARSEARWARIEELFPKPREDPE